MQKGKQRFSARILIILLTALIAVIPAGAKSDHWYCSHVSNHQRPHADANFQYISQYDGYYIGGQDNGPSDKVIYLTFDAGYENGNIAKILDILKRQEVTAAFFVLAQLVSHDTDIVKRMFDEGHLVCNHTAHHKDMSKITDRALFVQELEDLETLCREKTGKKLASYYRPPEGSFNEENLKWAQEAGYKTIFWSFAYADWDNNRQMNHDAALEKILSNIHPGEVMLLHPTSATNASILEEVIIRCKEQGYRFGTLDELTQKVAQNQ